MKEEKGLVADNRNLGGDFFLLKLESDYISRNSVPGNFVMVAVSGSNDPLLKRPLGIFDVKPPYFFLYYQVTGRGTKLLSEKRAGDVIDLIGPLGNGFPVFDNKNILMVAGGRGIVPLFFALKKFSERNSISLIYGAGTRSALNFTDEIISISPSGHFFYTDDGSGFKKGDVATDIDEIVRTLGTEIIFSCGPHAMLKSVADMSSRMGVRNYSSLEAFMGCGFGVCHSCVVKMSSGDYRKVCTDGPVFDSKEIDWETLK